MPSPLTPRSAERPARRDRASRTTSLPVAALSSSGDRSRCMLAWISSRTSRRQLADAARVLDPVAAVGVDLRDACRPASLRRCEPLRILDGRRRRDRTGPVRRLTIVVASARTVRMLCSRSRPPFAAIALSRIALRCRLRRCVMVARGSGTRTLRAQHARERVSHVRLAAADPATTESRSATGIALELIEAGAGSCFDERRRIADEHDRQPVGMQVAPRHALHVVDGDGVDALAVRLQLVEIEAVEDGVEHLQRDLAGRLDGERERSGQVLLRAIELALADAIANAAARTRRPSAAASRRSSRDRVFGLGDDVAGLLQRVHVGRRAVGQAALGCAARDAAGWRLRRRGP